MSTASISVLCGAAAMAIASLSPAADGEIQRQLQMREQQQMELRLKMQQQLDSALQGPRTMQPLQTPSALQVPSILQTPSTLQIPATLLPPRLDARRRALEHDQQQRLQMLHDRQLRSGIVAPDPAHFAREIERQRALNASGAELQRFGIERQREVTGPPPQ